jgi:hypothetical protein
MPNRNILYYFVENLVIKQNPSFLAQHESLEPDGLNSHRDASARAPRSSSAN